MSGWRSHDLWPDLNNWRALSHLVSEAAATMPAGLCAPRRVWMDRRLGWVYALRERGTFATLSGLKGYSGMPRHLIGLAIWRWYRGLSVRTDPVTTPPLPADVVVIPLPDTDGVVLASSRARQVTKVLSGPRGAETIRHEVEAFETARMAGISDMMAEILYSRADPSGPSVISTVWSPNHWPLRRGRRSSRQIIRNWLLPRMLAFHQHAGLHTVPMADYLEERLSSIPASLSETAWFTRLADSVLEEAQHSNIPVALTRVNGDLKVEHVHRSRQCLKIIDWGDLHTASPWFDLLLLELAMHPSKHIATLLAGLCDERNAASLMRDETCLDWTHVGDEVTTGMHSPTSSSRQTAALHARLGLLEWTMHQARRYGAERRPPPIPGGAFSGCVDH